MVYKISLLLYISFFLFLPINTAYPDTRHPVAGYNYSVSKDEVKKVILTYIKNMTGLEYKNIKLGDFRYREISLSSPDYSTEVKKRKGALKNGRLPLTVYFFIKDKKVKSIYLSVQVQVMSSIVYLNRYVNSGTVLGKDVLLTKETWVDYSPVEVFINNPSQAIGKILIREGVKMIPLKYSMLEISPIVKNGDRVNIIAEKNGITVTTKGVIRGKAAYGELVNVMNTSSKKILQVRVINEKNVKIDF